MKILTLLSSLLLLSSAALAYNVFFEDLSRYNGVHRVSCFDKSEINPEGFYLAFNVLENKYGWHMNYMGDGSTEIADESSNPSIIILNNVKTSLLLKNGQIMTYNLKRKTLKVVRYDNSLSGAEENYSDCKESEEIAEHDPTKW